MKLKICILLFVLAALGLRHAVATPPADGRVDRLKAAFVFNFLKFVEWPAGSAGAKDAPLRFAVIGDGSIAFAIKAVIDGKTVQGRPVNVIAFPTASAWKDASDGCQALFVTVATGSAWSEIRSAVSNQPVLTIADSSGFCAAGGMLNLLEEEDRIRFEANPSAAVRAGVKMRSELLRLAIIVKAEDPPP